MRRATFLGLWALAGVATLGGCSSKPELSTEEGWVRLAAVPEAQPPLISSSMAAPSR